MNGNFTPQEKARLVNEQLPGHTLDFRGKVVEAEVLPICPLCDKPIQGRSHSIEVNYRWVKVHEVCPTEVS